MKKNDNKSEEDTATHRETDWLDLNANLETSLVIVKISSSKMFYDNKIKFLKASLDCLFEYRPRHGYQTPPIINNEAKSNKSAAEITYLMNKRLPRAGWNEQKSTNFIDFSFSNRMESSLMQGVVVAFIAHAHQVIYIKL